MSYKLFPFLDPESQTLKEHLIDELDYVLVPAEAWNKLLNWYGCVEGQQPIVRKVSVSRHTCWSLWLLPGHTSWCWVLRAWTYLCG